MVVCGGLICSPGECSCSEQPHPRGWRATWPWEFARAMWGAIQTCSTGQISQDLSLESVRGFQSLTSSWDARYQATCCGHPEQWSPHTSLESDFHLKVQRGLAPSLRSPSQLLSSRAGSVGASWVTRPGAQHESGHG